MRETEINNEIEELGQSIEHVTRDKIRPERQQTLREMCQKMIQKSDELVEFRNSGKNHTLLQEVCTAIYQDLNKAMATEESFKLLGQRG